MPRKFLAYALTALCLSGCETVDLNEDRIPRTAVYLPFTTPSDWHIYGIGGEYGEGGALQSRRFIRSERVPADYPYPEYSYTGFGGLLLTCDVASQLHVFDLACPVERQPDVRIVIRDDNFAHCPKCGSKFDVFRIERNPGSPVSGPAFNEGYALRSYRIIFGADNRYALITL